MSERRGGFRRDSGNRRSGGGPNKSFGGRGGFRRDQEEREMHKAICSECGQECEVPFKPTEGKPVFCKECFRKKRKF